MNVVVIDDDNHGRIGVALNYYHAVKLLIDTYWIDDDTEVYDYNIYKWRTVKNALGAGWASLMLDTWDLNQFNNFWEGCFHLGLEKVIGTEDE